MIFIVQESKDNFTINYTKIVAGEIFYHKKFNCSADDVAQFLGNN